MPSESVITQMMNVFTEVIALGGIKERTAIVPNLSVIDAAPTGLTNFIIVQDDRDGDNILAKTVPGIVYANNDKVNVLFVKGTEPIAFQQGSESGSSAIWGIVPNTSTDIFYNNGDVGIGKSVAPDASLEILNTAQAQLRLTHTEDTKFVNFTLDTNHDLTITPSSIGQIILQPTTDSVDFFQVLDANGGTPILNVDSTNERIGISLSTPEHKMHLASSTSTNLMIQSSIDQSSLNAALVMRRSRGTISTPTAIQNGNFIFQLSLEGHNGTAYEGIRRIFEGTASENWTVANGGFEIAFYTRLNGTVGAPSQRLVIDNAGDVGIGATPLAQLHIDQASTTAAQPVALFDQADVSEEMFEFVSTIGVGNAIEAVGAKTLTVTHFIKATLPGSLTRYIQVGTIA